MKRLLRLYPNTWRRRYGDELAEILDRQAATPGVIFDLLRGAVDAHLHSSEPKKGVRILRRTIGMAVGLAVLLGASFGGGYVLRSTQSSQTPAVAHQQDGLAYENSSCLFVAIDPSRIHVTLRGKGPRSVAWHQPQAPALQFIPPSPPVRPGMTVVVQGYCRQP